METNKSQTQSFDGFLIGLVVVVALLIVAALFLIGRTPAVPDYREGRGPEDVAFNYLLAFQREEYERAYAYLNPNLPGYPPTAGEFFAQAREWCLGGENDGYTPVTVENVEIVDERAEVTIAFTEYSDRPSLFDDNRYVGRFDMALEQVDGNWYINESDRCWSYEWQYPPQESTE